MLKQVVGLKCLRCQQRIGSVLEGSFCNTCDSPVHTQCARPESSAGLCPACGSEATVKPPAPPAPPPEGPAPYPVNKDCPKCGPGEFKKRKPKRYIAFTYDRVCKSCGMRYTPPTPVWAGVLFLLVGILILGFVALSVLASLVNEGGVFMPPQMWAYAFVGLLVIYHGASSLLWPGSR